MPPTLCLSIRVTACTDPGIFFSGGTFSLAQLTEKCSNNVFLVLNIFYRVVQLFLVYFKEIRIFQDSRGGPTFFPGGGGGGGGPSIAYSYRNL